MSTLHVTGGCVYTADEEHRVHPDGGILARDGRIVAVGPSAEVAAAAQGLPEVETIDARGMMVMPGFVNAHWHDLAAVRFGPRGTLRPVSDRGDAAVFMALGGDLTQISMAFDAFTGLIDRLTWDEALAIARYSLLTQLRTGVTTLGDVGSVNRPQALATAARQLGMRCAVSTWAADGVCDPGGPGFKRTRDTDEVLREAEDLLRECAGAGDGLVRALPSIVYGVNMSDELAAGMGELVRRFDVPFATHVGALRHEGAVTRACFGAKPVERFARAGLLSSRFMAVHCAFLDDDERRLLLDAGAHISHSPAKYGATGESALSETRAIPELRRAGLTVSVSTDGGPLLVPGMVEEMRFAWSAYNEMFADPTEVRASDALAMGTRLPAEGLGWADDVGSLQAGHLADLVMVRADDWRYLLTSRPLEAFLAMGSSADVDTVVAGGRVLVRDGRPVHADDAEIRAGYLDALTSFSARCLGAEPGAVARALSR
jgi:cytosine/adenosine deaminase-related metal-dependent hydrolase